jgi:hypothetical protein
MAVNSPNAPDSLRRRIEVQGFTGLGDDEIRDLDPWLRFTPFLSGLIVVLGMLMGAYFLLIVLGVIFALGAVLPRHPFDFLYNGFIRSLENSPNLPVSPARRRLIYGILAIAFLAAALCFVKGYQPWGLSLGWLVAAYLAWLAAHQVCLISEGLHKLFGTPGMRGPASSSES